MSKPELLIKAHLPIPALAVAHRLDLCEAPESIFRILEERPTEAEESIRTIVREAIRIADADVRIDGLRFSDVDSRNITNAVVYFTIILRGRRDELAKVFGDDKIPLCED